MIDRTALFAQLKRPLIETALPGLGPAARGKVRDSYVRNGRRFIVTTDRISAFDRVLGTIPFKGQVLNRVAAFWFERTRDLVPNHLVGCPDPAVMEVLVRAYLTGSTSTSIWTHYAKGVRNFCGNALPDGMTKHQKLARPILT